MARFDIFSTPVWHIDGTPLELIDELHEGAYRFKKKYPSENKSNEGGYQSPSFDWKEFHPQGIEYVNKIIDDTLVEDTFILNQGLQKKFTVISWWYNINPKGAWNLPHTHPFSELAFVFYLTDSNNLLQLINPHLQRLNAPNYMMPNAKKGDIIIFPADLIHFVLPNPLEEDRVCVSMNLQLS